MKIKALLNILLFLLALALPAHAASKSNTVQVSCTIPPSIGLATAERGMARAQTSLEKQYQMSESFCLRKDQKIKLVSLTAL